MIELINTILFDSNQNKIPVVSSIFGVPQLSVTGPVPP